MRRRLSAACLLAAAAACGRPEPPPPAVENVAPNDEMHAGITEPHGDHSPHHGGMVLMNGDVHYEVVLDPSGRYEVWFSDAVRTELPASMASNVRLEVARPDQPVETLALDIDEAGESWVGQGKAVTGESVMVKLTYDIRGVPHEVEIPFVAREK